MKEPVDHIIRPRLPWRSPNDPAVTECGYDASKVKTLTRDEFLSRLSDYGQQRTALFTCMTCTQAATQWPTWNDDPRKALEREIIWECRWRSGKHGYRLKDELLVITTLIAKHKDEFDGLLETLRQQQEWRERRVVNANDSAAK